MGEPIAELGRVIGLCVWTGTEWVKASADANDYLIVSVEEILNGVQLRRGNHVVANYDDVPTDTALHDLVNVTGSGVLEWIDFGTDHASSYIRVDIDGDYVYLLDPKTPDVDVYIYASLLQYGNQETSLWRLIVFDDVNDYYALCLKRPIWFNTSLLVRYRAGSAAAKTSVVVGYHLF